MINEEYGRIPKRFKDTPLHINAKRRFKGEPLLVNSYVRYKVGLGFGFLPTILNLDTEFETYKEKFTEAAKVEDLKTANMELEKFKLLIEREINDLFPY